MGLFSRLTAGIRARSRGMVGDAGAQDYPDRSYREVRTRAGEAASGHEFILGELKKQAGLLDVCMGKLDLRARETLRDVRYRQASEALYRKMLAARQMAQLQSTIGKIKAEQTKLSSTLARLELKVRAFLDERQTLRTQLPSEEARLRIGESARGLGEELAAVSYAIDRATENAATARTSCEGIARFLALQCRELSKGVVIPEKDRHEVGRALKALRAEVSRS
jgi:phage shock protein A